MLGGMAELSICRDEYGVYVAKAELSPTMTYARHDSGKWEFYGMRLERYTQQMADHHLIDDTDPDTMWALYERITGQ